MKKLLLSGLLCCAFALIGMPASQASGLDPFLQPHCGVGEPEFTTEQILAQYGPEIYARASGYSVLTVDAQSEILMWYLGGLRTPEAIALSQEVITKGTPEFRRMVMGAVSYRPYWTGMRLVAAGALAAAGDEMTRDSASSILADTDYASLTSSGSLVTSAKTEILGLLQQLIAAETNPRLRGNFQTAQAKIQAL